MWIVLLTNDRSWLLFWLASPTVVQAQQRQQTSHLVHQMLLLSFLQRGHLHCMDKGDTISSSMSSTSSVMMKWAGLGRVLPIQLGSMLRAATKEWMPGLLTIWKPQRISICCHRCRRSLSAAVTSLSACLKTDERKLQVQAMWQPQQEQGHFSEEHMGYRHIWIKTTIYS